MTPLLDRSQTVSFGQITKPPVKLIALSKLIENDHLSPNFNPPAGQTAGEIFNYMLFLQQRKYHETILNKMPVRAIHLRHLKLLLEKHDPLLVKRAVQHATIRCERPFSCKLVKIYCGVVLKILETTWQQDLKMDRSQ